MLRILKNTISLYLLWALLGCSVHPPESDILTERAQYRQELIPNLELERRGGTQPKKIIYRAYVYPDPYSGETKGRWVLLHVESKESKKLKKERRPIKRQPAKGQMLLDSGEGVERDRLLDFTEYKIFK